MEAKHTAGPWKIIGPDEDGNRIISAATYDTIAPIHDPSWGTVDDPATQRANARLIAAAPDLAGIVRRLIDANNAAPDFGLADCVDNDGEHYQSADFAALIIDAHPALGLGRPTSWGAVITYRDLPYVEAECAALAGQLSALSLAQPYEAEAEG